MTSARSGRRKAGTSLTSSLTAEQVQTIDEMYHAIAINSIILSILTHSSRNYTTDIALVSQYIIELNTYGSSISLQKVLRNLSVPN